MTALDSFPVSIQQPKCPKLDSTLKAQVPKACKDGDRLFCRLRTLVLDAVGPLTRVLELQQKGRLTSEAASQVLRFLGKASGAISTDADCLNEDLRPLVEEPDRFKDAAPALFGTSFVQSMKDHVDSVHSFRKLSQPPGRGAGRPTIWEKKTAPPRTNRDSS